MKGNKKATVKYRDGEDYKTVNLDNTEMTLNKIEINKFDKMVKRVDFYKKGRCSWSKFTIFYSNSRK